ncbi:hypothetical protein Ocin01_09101 [Orchesella cincta]|uniref:Uncharacterized protein n=1 Tax=Orchesella cincta TaxID=48709 RepID=A0A1D2MX05_ORCCI|nr:hypothetical protein Ocin01_09101 [Orchesella cincta]
MIMGDLKRFPSDLRPSVAITFVFVGMFTIITILAPTQVQGYDVDSVCDICSFYAGELSPGKILKKMMRLFCQNREIHYIDHNLRDACSCKNYYY